MIEGVTQVPLDLRWKGLNLWRDYVVGFFVEQRLPYPVVKEALKKKWRTKGDYEMVADTDLFYFKFSNEEDKRKVLENSPIYIAGKCFIVTQWTQDIEKRKSTVKAIPIWVNLYNVPKELWTGEGMGFLASRIGDPQRMDEATATRKRLLYARVCILVEIASELPESFDINMGGEDIRKITVEYGWIPKLCDHCKRLGHKIDGCLRRGNNQRADTQVEVGVTTNVEVDENRNNINEIGEVNIGHIDAAVITRQAETVNTEGVDRTVGNPNEVSMAELILSAIAVESEGVLRRTDETSVVAENAEGIVATKESTQLVEGSEVVVNETNMALDRIEGSELAVEIATAEVTEVATGNAQVYDSDSDTEMSQSNMFAALVPYVEEMGT
ncbi:hypothetical protein IFM89_002665 [Coptis chinensis]|uniref:DUF4283 domain-containing protein n=1 Tax=Coptis chinensis TaxID=261450 RepID=A0A835IM61_9MAGN|nr:hypothetical protein IFM89_002665 [Coptis chinensis]